MRKRKNVSDSVRDKTQPSLAAMFVNVTANSSVGAPLSRSSRANRAVGLSQLLDDEQDSVSQNTEPCASAVPIASLKRPCDPPVDALALADSVAQAVEGGREHQC